MRNRIFSWAIAAAAFGFVPAIALADGEISVTFPAFTSSVAGAGELNIPEWNPAAYPGATLTNFELSDTASATLNITVTFRPNLGPTFSTFAPEFYWGKTINDQTNSFNYGSQSVTVTPANPTATSNFGFPTLPMPDAIGWGPMFTNFNQNMIVGTGLLPYDGTRYLTVGNLGAGGDIYNTEVINSESFTYQYTANYFYSGTIVPEPASISLLCSAPILLMRRRKQSKSDYPNARRA